MIAQQLDNQPSEKRFRLVKFFAYTSFVVILFFSFPFSMLLSQNAKDILMKSYENYALLLGENLNHQIYYNFALPVLKRFGEIRLSNEKQQEIIDQVIQNTIHGFKIDLVKIYDIKEGIILYSTDPKLIGTKGRDTLGYRTALRGEYYSGVISDSHFLWGFGIEKLGGEKKIKTYIPLTVTNPYTGEKYYTFAILELTQDLSHEYRSLVKFQYLIFGLSILIMGLIFVALILIVHRAEGIIEQRTQAQMELEAQLNQAERLAALGQMIAGVSHEIRNPLGIIRSTAEILAGMESSDKTQKKLTDVIVEASSRLNNIVTEFMDFARPKDPNRQECDLGEIISNVLNFIQPELEKQGIALHNKITGQFLKINADPHLLYRAFLNIFLNAIQAMGHGGELTITVEEDVSNYTLQIEDTGIGISEEDLGKVFNPFFSTKDIGSGLGLSIVRNFVESHNGAIWIKSRPGSGTQVMIRLPKK
jgi:two-component system, NtrC family, sensor histidine kinase HydH